MFKRFSLFLVPTVFQTAVSLVILPVTTFFLDQEDFGVFALVMSITGLGTVFASMGSGYMIAAHYPTAETGEKKRLVSSMMLTGVSLAILYAFVVGSLFHTVFTRFEIFSQIPESGLLIGLFSMVASITWIIALDVLTIEGRAGVFAIVIIAQVLFSSIATILALSVWEFDLLSLFIGNLAGSCVLFIGSLWAFRREFWSPASFLWIKKFLKLGFATLLTNVLESLHVVIERFVLGGEANLAQLGLYTHSQQYKTIAMMALKAGSRTVWPITLSEASDSQSNFPITKKAWDLVYLGLTAAGVLFATFGKDIIGILTNGKFSDAYVLAALWMVYLLIQNAGKPHTGILWVTNRGPLYARLQLFALLISIVLLIFLVPSLGIYAALIALFVQMTVFRIAIQWWVRKYRKVPFQDYGVISGSLIILATLALSWYFQFGRVENLVLLLLVYVMLVYLGRTVLYETFSRFMQNLRRAS